MIVEIFNFDGKTEEANYASNIPDAEHFIADVSFTVNSCPYCWAEYNRKITIKEYRPFVPSDQGKWPKLVILPVHWTPAGKQGERVVHEKSVLLKHYKERYGARLFLLEPGSEFYVGETLRHTKLLEGYMPELVWSHEGLEMRYMILFKGNILDINFEEVSKYHFRCRDKKPIRIIILSRVVTIYPPAGFHTEETGNVRWGEEFSISPLCKKTIQYFAERYNMDFHFNEERCRVAVTPKEGGVQIPQWDIDDYYTDLALPIARRTGRKTSEVIEELKEAGY